MLQSTLSNSGLAILAEVALVIFITTFVSVLVRLWLRDAELHDYSVSLPLEDDGGPAGGDVK